MEGDAVFVGPSKLFQDFVVRRLPLRRPFPPWRPKAAAQIFERRKSCESWSALPPEALKFPIPFRAFALAERLIGEAKSSRLDSNYAAIVDDICPPQRRNLVPHFGRQPGKFSDGFDIDIARVEEQSAVGRIGTGVGGVVEQRMQRIERDAGGSEIGSQVDQCGNR